ncbi:MAG: LCP family protein [Acidimicrobiia bacterium]|nr:LCP family protein [Acidimicrobiia bacterium]
MRTTAIGLPRLTIVKRLVLAAFLIVVGFVGWTGVQIWSSWNSVDKIPYNPAGTRAALPSIPEPAPGDTVPPFAVSPPVDDATFDSFLVVGSGFQGRLADVIMLFLLPDDGGQPSIVSLPRDLYLPSPCAGEMMRINANYNGCGDTASGPQLLALAVADFTGIEVDHFALFDFEGFDEIIDDVGGVTICVDNPVRDADAWLSLPAGCTEASGAQALGWVRTRKTQELVNGSWRAVPGQSDLTRHQHQQDVIFQLFDRLQDFSSLGDLTNKVDSLSDTFTVDADLTMGSAISLAWSLRGFDQSDFKRLTIPVESFTTAAGAAVLKPTATFSSVLQEAYPELRIAGGPLS